MSTTMEEPLEEQKDEEKAKESKPIAMEESNDKKAEDVEEQNGGDAAKDDKKPSATKRPASKMDKKTQKMLADLQRCKKQMEESRQAIQKPPIKPFTPAIFNSLSPYYNTYTVDYLLHDLQNQDQPHPRLGWGHRAMALGVIDPEISWRMDNMPGPVQASRIPGTLFRSKTWCRNVSGGDNDLGSTRLPPLPMPSVPKFHQASFQPNKMTYNELAKFRVEMKSMNEKLQDKRARDDYDRTVQDWQRMNLSELKGLPPHSRYHVKKAIFSYLGTSHGSAKALKPLTRELAAHTPEPLVN